MKIFSLNKINKWNLLLLLLVSAFFQFACKKEGGGTPIITSVSLLDSTKRDSSITKALPGTYVVIHGQGFSGLQQVFVNDTSITFNSAIQSDNSIVVAIPSSVPTEATKPNVSNKVRIITDHGEASFSFTLVPPAPSIVSISNEMALPGSTITITGSSFYNVQKVIFPGSLEVTTVKADPSGNMLTVQVPATLTQSGPIQVVSKYGTGTNSFIILNGEKQPGMLATFDYEGTSVFGWAYWGGVKASDANAFPGGRGNYIELKPAADVKAGDASWYGDNRVVNVSHDPLVSAASITDAVANYALKFEMYQKTVWKNGSLVIRLGNPWTYSARFTPWKGAAGAQFQTNGWVTVSIPLTEFKTKSSSGVDAAGDPAASFAALLKDTKGDLGIMLINDSSTPIPQYNAAFDNVRIVKVQ